MWHVTFITWVGRNAIYVRLFNDVINSKGLRGFMKTCDHEQIQELG